MYTKKGFGGQSPQTLIRRLTGQFYRGTERKGTVSFNSTWIFTRKFFRHHPKKLSSNLTKLCAVSKLKLFYIVHNIEFHSKLFGPTRPSDHGQ